MGHDGATALDDELTDKEQRDGQDQSAESDTGTGRDRSGQIPRRDALRLFGALG